MPSVSIIIPILNRSAYLPRLFQSLTAVDYEDLEVIFVDNGSSDGSLSHCRAFAKDAPMVVRVLEEAERGASKARNRGLTACRTEWVYFFDSDDDISPTFLEELMPLTAGFDMVAFPTLQEVKGRVAQRSFLPSRKPSSQILSATLNTQGMLFRTEYLRSIGGWNGELSIWDDWELGVRALLHSPRIRWFTLHPFHHIYVHPDSITGPSMTSRRDVLDQALQTVERELSNDCDRRALYLRRCILNGTLRREGASPLYLPDEGFSLLVRLYGKWLSSYTAWGGRGAWRMALIFC